MASSIVQDGSAVIVEDVELYPLSSPASPTSPTSSHPRQRAGGDVRPSVRLGRQLSLKRKRHVLAEDGDDDGGQGEGGASNVVDSEFQRNAVRYRSLQHTKPKRSESPVRMRRASSLTNVGHNEIRVNFGDLRASSRRLEDRIARHHQTLARRPKYTTRNIWQHFIDVKWPKIKSRLRVVYSYELWNHHMKEVEGHFGTAVISYFVFLRWLFFMNLIIFLLWFGLAVFPQLVWVAGTNAPRTPSQLTCVFYLDTTGPPRECPDGGPTFDLGSGSPAPDDLDDIRLLCRGGGVNDETLDVGECQLDMENDTLVARREDPNTVITDLTSCANITNLTGVDLYYHCLTDIDPVVLWYQHIFAFFLGRGIFNDTVLFHGRYTNETIEVIGNVKYNLPLAYILLTGTVFLISVILLVYKMGQAYNESNVKLGNRENINYCNKLFSSWEFSIIDHNAAKIRKAQIKREFEEDIADLKKRSEKRDVKEWVLVILSRTVANLFVVLILIGAGTAIFRAAQLGLSSQLSGDSLQLEGFVLPIVFTAFNITLPILFSFLARFERFKTQSGEIRMTLIRAIIVRLSSLIVLFVTLFILISCTQTFAGDDEMMLDQTEDEGTCQFSVPDINIGPNNGTSENPRENCPLCWETFVGQELYKLGLINFVLSAITTITVETARNYLSRLPYKIFNERIGKGNFNIAKSILDLIYTQALLWLGFFYSPFLPFVILVTSFMMFYVKKYSLIWNLVPSKRGTFKTTRTNFLFLSLLLAVLLTSLVPIGYAVARLHPSETCGPFRGKELIYDTVTEFLEQADCKVQQVFDYVQSTSFLIPIIIVLILLCYAQWVVLRARNRRFRLLKQQLVLEAADSTFYGEQLKKKEAREEEGRGIEETDLGPMGVAMSVAPLQQKLSALKYMTEEEKGVALQQKRKSDNSYRLSIT